MFWYPSRKSFPDARIMLFANFSNGEASGFEFPTRINRNIYDQSVISDEF